MPSTEETHAVESYSRSQEALILNRLRIDAGNYVGLPALHYCSGSLSVATRVSMLRKKGHMILNRVTVQGNGQPKMSEYCLLP